MSLWALAVLPQCHPGAFCVDFNGYVISYYNVSNSCGVRPALMVSPFSCSPTGGATVAHHIKGAASFHAASAGGKQHVSGVCGGK